VVDLHVGKHWATRFVQRHPDLHTIKLKFLDQSRKMMHKKELLQEWFELFQMLRDEGAEDCDIWNMDETGFRIGVISQSSLVVTRKAVKAAYMANPEDRTLVTSVECVSVDGRVIPPLAILPNKVFLPWFHPNQVPDEYQTAYLEAGYNNLELALLWLDHFYEHTRNGNKKRILLLDGHRSYINAEFLNKAEALRILILALPPHSTHLMQPLDVRVFQSLKGAHSRVVEEAVRAGETTFPKPAFMKHFHKIRMKGLKEHTIKSAWRKCGLVPFNPNVVLSKITELEVEPRPMTPEKTPAMSSPLRRTPRTVPQFAKGSKFILNILSKLVSLLDPDDPASDIVLRFERIIRGLRAATVAGQEAIEQVETAARKKRDEQLVKELAKNYQSRKGGLMSAKAGREMWDAREISKQSAQQRKAAKLAQKAEEYEAEQAIRAAETARQARRAKAVELMDILDGLDDSEFTDWATQQQEVEAWMPDYDDELDVMPQIDPEVQAFNNSIKALETSQQRRHEPHHGTTRAADWGMDENEL
jgi:hypothetical protein